MLNKRVILSLAVGLAVLALACTPAVAPTATPTIPPKAASAASTPATTPAPAVAAATATPRKIEKVAISYQTTGFADFCVVAAKNKGFYKEEGLEVETPILASDVAVKALVGGSDIDYVTSWGSSIRAAVQGVPVKAVMTQMDKTPHVMVARSEFKSVADLRGKKVGVNSTGGTVELLARQAIKKAGMDPDKDVNFVVISDSATRLVSVRTGIIDASVIDPAFAVAAEKEGLSILVRFKDLVDIAMTGISTSDKKIKENPDQVFRVVKATNKACRYIRDPKNKAEVVKMIMDELKLDQGVATATYDLSIDTVSEDGTARDSAIQTDIDTAKERSKITDNIPFSQVVDFQFVRKLKESR